MSDDPRVLHLQLLALTEHLRLVQQEAHASIDYQECLFHGLQTFERAF